MQIIYFTLKYTWNMNKNCEKEKQTNKQTKNKNKNKNKTKQNKTTCSMWDSPPLNEMLFVIDEAQG